MSYLHYAEVILLESFFESCGVHWGGTHRQLQFLFREAGVFETEGFDAQAFEELGTKRRKWHWIFENCSNRVISDAITAALDAWDRGTTDGEKLGFRVRANQCKDIALSLVLPDGEWDEITTQEPHFYNQKDLLIQDLQKAKLGIWICMYLFNDWDIAKALIEKANEGVSINLIIQDDEKNTRQPFWKELEANSSVLWWYPDAKGINHHKFCIIDTRSVWQGSFNFTRAAATRNRECLSRDTNREVIDKFAEEFKDIKRYLVKEKKLRQELF